MNIKIDNEYMQMQQALQSQYSSINVQNTNSDLNRFYHMNVPFQLTLEYCSGSELEDYINIMTLSAEKSLMYQESAATKNFARTKDVMHYHDFFEFVIVLEGSIVQKIEGKDYLYAAGSCCLINRSLCHLEHYHAKTKVLFIGMSPEFVSELFKSAQNSAFSAEKKICNGEIYQFITDDLKYPGKKAYLDFIPAYQNHKHALHLHDLAQSMIQTLLYPDLGQLIRSEDFCAHSCLIYLHLNTINAPKSAWIPTVIFCCSPVSAISLRKAMAECPGQN